MFFTYLFSNSRMMLSIWEKENFLDNKPTLFKQIVYKTIFTIFFQFIALYCIIAHPLDCFDHNFIGIGQHLTCR